MEAQVAVEFIITLAFMLLVLIAAVAIAYQKSVETEEEMGRLEAESILYEAASVINSAYVAGDGFRTTVFLPATIGGHNYTIRTSSTLIWMEVNGGYLSDIMLTDNVTGNFTCGENTVRNGGGGIFLNG